MEDLMMKTQRILNGEFVVRPARMDDMEAAVAMFNACARQMYGVDEHTVEQYEGEWSDPAINLELDTRLVLDAANGRVAGCIEVWNTAPHVFSWVWGRVHPEYGRRGVGTYLMQWAEARACELVEKAPAEARVVINVGTPSVNEDAALLLYEQGYQAIRHSWTMAIDLDSPPAAPLLPAGVMVRPFRHGEEDEALYRADEEAFKDHWGHVDVPFEEGFARWLHRRDTNPDYDPSLWFVAVDGEEIAGVSLCWPRRTEDPEMGWVGTLGVRRPWRRQGLGLALLQHSFVELYGRGRRRVGLGVDASSLTGATRLYEKAGMRPIRQFDLYEKELRPGIEMSTQ
jgi:mycothiol synthase